MAPMTPSLNETQRLSHSMVPSCEGLGDSQVEVVVPIWIGLGVPVADLDLGEAQKMHTTVPP